MFLKIKKNKNLRGVLENEKEIFFCYFLFDISYIFVRL